MKALESIVDDIFNNIEPEKIDIILGDLTDNQIDRKTVLLMRLSRLNEVNAVNNYLVEELGSLGVNPFKKD